MSAPKEKSYFGFVPKDQLQGFLERLVKELKKEKNQEIKKILNLKSEVQKMNLKEFPLKISLLIKQNSVNFLMIAKII